MRPRADDGGLGALLRTSWGAGQLELVEALLGASVSPFLCDAKASTALQAGSCRARGSVPAVGGGERTACSRTSLGSVRMTWHSRIAIRRRCASSTPAVPIQM